jgi:hypothetical protein
VSTIREQGHHVDLREADQPHERSEAVAKELAALPSPAKVIEAFQ